MSESQHQKLDQLLVMCSRLDERSVHTDEELGKINIHLEKLNGKTSKNTIAIALMKQNWGLLAVLVPLIITVGANYIFFYS